MPPLPLTEWRDRYAGADVWVVAAGPSLDHLPAGVLTGRLVVGVNDVWRLLPVDWTVRKELAGTQDAIDDGQRVVRSRFDCGGCDNRFEGDGVWWEFTHSQNRDSADPDLMPIELRDDRLVVSWSTITTAMHFAAYLGAGTIFVAGHDLGAIDGAIYASGYRDPGRYHEPEANGSHEAWYASWLAQIERQSFLVRDRLQAVYGCRIVHVSPWLGHGLEGHTWR